VHAVRFQTVFRVPPVVCKRVTRLNAFVFSARLDRLTAILPRQTGKRRETARQVEKRPSHDDAIVHVQQENDGHRRVSRACGHKKHDVAVVFLRDRQTRERAVLPESIGHSFPTNVIPPEPKYCPMATSWKNIGIPQNNMAMK